MKSLSVASAVAIPAPPAAARAQSAADDRVHGDSDQEVAVHRGIAVAHESGFCIDTAISHRGAPSLRPGVSMGQDGTGTIAGGPIMVSPTAAS